MCDYFLGYPCLHYLNRQRLLKGTANWTNQDTISSRSIDSYGVELQVAPQNNRTMIGLYFLQCYMNGQWEQNPQVLEKCCLCTVEGIQLKNRSSRGNHDKRVYNDIVAIEQEMPKRFAIRIIPVYLVSDLAGAIEYNMHL